MSRYGYERLSKDRSLRGINVEIQKQEIDDYAEDSGEPIKHHFKDNDLSASEFATKPRKGYLELIDAITQGLVTEIIVSEIPRLARLTEHAIELITLSKATKLQFVKTTDGMIYDLHTPRGRKSFRDAVSDAEFESDQSSTRQHRKKNKQAEAGRYHGGRSCYGFERAVHDDDGFLLNRGRCGVAIVPEEVAIFNEAKDRILAGEKEIHIIRDFNRRGIVTTDGHKWRAGKVMTTLLRRRYVAFDEFPGPGTRTHKGKEYRAVYPALISKEEHEIIRAKRARYSLQNKVTGSHKSRSYAYTGMVECGKCGALAYGNGKTLPSGTYMRRYVCRRYDNYGVEVGCGNVMRSADPVEEFVKEAVIYRFNTPEVARALAPREDEDRYHHVITRLTQLRTRRQEIVDERACGDFTRDDYLRARDVIDDEVRTLQRELDNIQSSEATELLPADGQIREAWDASDADWHAAVTKLLVEKIVILPVGAIGGRRWHGYRFDPDSVQIVWRH